jgi:Abnormal spindle-like microcephaly-assoc'd, ASPM-SPD-2-Hydin
MKAGWFARGVLVFAVGAVGLLIPTLALGHGGGGGGGGHTTTTTTTSGGASISLSPTSLNFGSQANGTTSAAQTIMATNTGTANLFFNNVAESGSFGLDYTIGNDGCIGLTLPPGQSCQISVTFSPNNTGAMSESIVFTDNAANSPQSVSMTGTGTGTSTPLSIDDQFFACSGGVCDITDAFPTIVNNFYANGFTAQGGTPPYTWSSSHVPSGLTLHSSGLIFGDPTTLGTTTFQVIVKDAAGNTQTGTFSLPTTQSPAPSPGGACQTYGTLTDSLSGPAISGQTPSGTGTSNETKLSGCGGFALFTVQVKNVNLPDGTVLWVTFDGLAVGEINLSRGSGTMPSYNFGDFSVGGFDQVRVFDSLPDASPFQQILIGGGFG